MVKKTSFESLWSALAPKVRAHGVDADDDLQRVRTQVKNLLISAGWSDTTGQASFVSDKDVKGCISAASALVDEVAPKLAAARQVVRNPAGSVPTKSQVVAASASGSAPVELSSTRPTGTFAPVTAKIGDRCPRCQGSMDPVALVNDRAAIYCSRDRVVLPLPSDYSIRY